MSTDEKNGFQSKIKNIMANSVDPDAKVSVLVCRDEKVNSPQAIQRFGTTKRECI